MDWNFFSLPFAIVVASLVSRWAEGLYVLVWSLGLYIGYKHGEWRDVGWWQRSLSAG